VPSRARVATGSWTGGLIGLLLILFVTAELPAQNPPVPPAPQNPPPGGAAPPTPPPGRGRGRGAVQVLPLSTTAWVDGGQIPLKYTQAGDEVSPPLTWTNPPDMTASFVLLVHDLDAAAGDGLSDLLHWLVWSIPATARSLPEGVPQGAMLPDGSRQISATGPNYRGPAAPASGPPHHYVFELYALDTTLDVPAVGASPAETRAAVTAAMAGHVRGKGVLVGLFKRN
jgi:Raf kinase inhibitor-like YbhB/YbcL family protein